MCQEDRDVKMRSDYCLVWMDHGEQLAMGLILNMMRDHLGSLKRELDLVLRIKVIILNPQSVLGCRGQE